MVEKLCPVFSCMVVDGGYEKDGKTYCCEPCASGSASQCDCGCCTITEDYK